MDSFQISILILQIVNIVFSVCIAPLVSGAIEFTRRIEKSNCCGGNLELTHINELKKEVSQHQIAIQQLTNQQVGKRDG